MLLQEMPSIQMSLPLPRSVDSAAVARALEAAKAAASGTTADADGNISVMETRRFAGKNIQVWVDPTMHGS